MNKSQLRQLIRESIKGLMTEQAPPPPGLPAYTTTDGCSGPGYSGAIVGGPFQSGRHLQINDNGTIRDPQIGDVINITDLNPVNLISNGICSLAANDCTVKITNVYPPCGAVSTPSNSCAYAAPTITRDLTTCSTTGQQTLGCTNTTAANYDPNATQDDGSCMCSIDGGYTGANFNNWTGFMSWFNSWSNSGPFNNQTNVNQPCAHICNKILDWNNNCQNAGPVQQNQLAVKIQLGMYQYYQNNCSTSNAQACQGLTI